MGGIAEGVGNGLGFYLPNIFVSPDDINYPERARENIGLLCYVTGIIFAVGQVIALLMFKERPFVPPT